MAKRKPLLSKTAGIFYLLVLGVILFVIIGNFCIPNEIGYKNTECQEFDVKWYRVLADGEKNEIEVPGKCEAESGELVVTEAVVPSYVSDGKFLCFRNSLHDMQVYIDGELRHEYTTKDTRIFGKTSENVFVFVPVYAKDAGKTLRVEISSLSSYSGTMNTVYYGDQFAIWKTLVEMYGMEFVIASFMLVLAVITIVICMLLKACYRKEIGLEYLGWGILLVAIWIISVNSLRQLFFSKITLISFINYFSLMLLPLPFAMYINYIQKFRYKKIYYMIDTLILGNFAICSVLQFLNIADFAQMLMMIHAVFVISVLGVCVSIFLDIKKGYIRSYLLIVVGFIVLVVAAIAEVLQLYICDDIVNATEICVGLIVLLFMAVIKTQQDIVNLERERQKVMFDNKNQTEFLAKMSYEIRTPINTMIGMNEIIARENKNEEIAQYVFNAQQAGRTLLALVNDVLDFSKIESGTLKLAENVYQLASLINDEVHMLQARAEKKGLEVAINIDEKLPSYLYGDEVKIRQIISVLLSNAIKQTEQGRITFSVGCYTGDVGQFFIKISVADTGVGIREEDIDNIFKSLDELDEKNIDGVKVFGLHIIKNLADEMQGTIKARSLYGKGSLFTVTIPQKVIDDAPIGMVADKFAEEKMQIGRYKASFVAPEARILSVDDNEMNLAVVKGLLKNTQIQIDTTLSPEECLELCKTNKYDLIFMDHMMPKIDGIQTMKMIHCQTDGYNRETPIVVLTANAIAGIREKYMADGFAEYLSKPIAPEKLERILTKFIPEDMIIRVEEVEEIEEEVIFAQRNVEMSKTEVNVTSSDIKNTTLETQETTLQEVGIDKNIGLTYFGGDEELYEEMLKTYYEQGKEYADKLPNHFENMDWRNYATIAHAMKSTSLSIGAVNFSEIAKQHEMAGREKNVNFIKENWNDFYDYFIKILNTIEHICGLNVQKTLVEPAQEVSSELYQKECEILLDYLKNYEMNPAVEQINKIATIKTSKIDTEKQAKLLEDMKQAVDDFDFATAEKLLTQWIKEM